jgi:excinuclease UvrABC nuclease subunit
MDYGAFTNQEMSRDEAARLIKELEKQMKTAAQALEFEQAALLRDQISELRKLMDEGKPEWEKIREEERQRKLREIKGDKWDEGEAVSRKKKVESGEGQKGRAKKAKATYVA